LTKLLITDIFYDMNSVIMEFI